MDYSKQNNDTKKKNKKNYTCTIQYSKCLVSIKFRFRKIAIKFLKVRSSHRLAQNVEKYFNFYEWGR